MKKGLTITLLAGFSAATLAYAAGPAADDLTIVNNTNYASTCVINRGACSANLPHGITEPHSTNTVDKRTVGLACLANSTNCTADVYMTRDCSGQIVAKIIFDTKTGVKSVASMDSRYQLSYDASNPFRAQMDGGPEVSSR